VLASAIGAKSPVIIVPEQTGAVSRETPATNVSSRARKQLLRQNQTARVVRRRRLAALAHDDTAVAEGGNAAQAA
jgi:hypothetical protein